MVVGVVRMAVVVVVVPTVRYSGCRDGEANSVDIVVVGVVRIAVVVVVPTVLT